MDDQARAAILSFSKIIQHEDKSITIEEKIRAIVTIGHLLCCGMMMIFLRMNYHQLSIII